MWRRKPLQSQLFVKSNKQPYWEDIVLQLDVGTQAPHTKNKRRENSNYNSPHGTMNNLNRYHIKQNKYLTYQQPDNKRDK